MKLFVCSMFLPTMAIAQTWVPYTAHYVETSTAYSSSGAILSQMRKDVKEVREPDGSVATFEQIGDKIVSGSIWLACGDVVTLNYTNKTGTISHDSRRVRKHFQIPQNDKPLGTATIAQLNVKGWPVHFSNGTGAMWVDVENDIVAKSEAHLGGANGMRTEYVKQLQSIDFTLPDPSRTELPPNFTLDTTNGSAQHSCGQI
jgi:hypothetical protein